MKLCIIECIPNNVSAKHNTALVLTRGWGGGGGGGEVVSRKCVGWLLELPYCYEIS